MSRPDAIVEASLNWRYVTEDDLEPLAELMAALEYFDDPIERRDLDDLLADWAANSSPTAVVGRDKGDTVVAYAWNRESILEPGQPQVWLSTGVHPSWRHRRIGRKLLAWSIEAAMAWHADSEYADAPLWLGYLVDEKFTGLRASVQEFEFAPQRYFYDMHRALGDVELPAVKEPDGVRAVPYEPSMSEDIRALHNEVVSAMAGARRVGREEWEQSLAVPEERSDLSWVAVVDEPGHEGHGSYVGYALNCEIRDWVGRREFREGWTERLGVCPGWWGMGVGIALLTASMNSFARVGFDSAGLGADTDDAEDGERLRQACGYEMADQVILYGRTLPPASASA